MKIKTYGVPGLTEWHGKVKAGSIEVAVSFTGGTASPSGAQPAYYMTKDPIVQFVIEHCKEFRDGFIILVMSQDMPGQHPRMAVPKPKTKPKDPPTLKPSNTDDDSDPGTQSVKTSEEQQPTSEQDLQDGGDVDADTDNDADGGDVDADTDNDADGGDVDADTDNDADGSDVADCNKVEVADKNEAIEYLKEHFADKNYTATSLRTKAAFDAACKECGVEFVFTA